MSANLSAPPLATPLIESADRPFITRVWNNWFLSLTTRMQSAAYAVTTLSLSGQAASIGATDLVAVPASGLYRVSYRIRLTTAATAASSILLTITSTDGGVACPLATVAYVGNAVNAPQQGSFIVRTDAGAPISYATTYASAGATAMVYQLDVVTEIL